MAGSTRLVILMKNRRRRTLWDRKRFRVACYILSDESSIPFYSTSNGYNIPFYSTSNGYNELTLIFTNGKILFNVRKPQKVYLQRRTMRCLKILISLVVSGQRAKDQCVL